MKELRNRTAILTGASRGIGPYIAKTLARQGVNLALAARDAGKLEETRAACEALGVRTISVATDVTSDSDLRRLVDTAERDLGPIDILVNNAGIEISSAVVDLSPAEIDAVINTNLRAPVQLARIVLPGMLQRHRGAIVHLSSLSGKGGTPYNTLYSATKFGLQGLTEAAAFELEGTGVHMSTVCPGFVADAGMWANRGGKAPRMMREVSPQRVADAVVKAIRGKREVLVAPGPIRPLLALNQLFPSLQRPIIKRMGIVQAMRPLARSDGGAPHTAVPESDEKEKETADVS
jgi:short-subunit dehydrogenase